MKNQFLTACMLLISGSSFCQTFTNYTTTDGLLSNNVICLDVAGLNTLWFGTQSGISVFDGTVWTEHTNTSDPGLVDNNIQAIKVLSNGDVWAGTDFGACHYDGNSWTTYTTTDGLGNNQIKCIAEASNGDLWFGTNTGATKFDGVAWTTLGTADGLPFGGVTAISFEANGNVWLGSGLGGIMIYDGANLTPITTTDGLVDNRIRAIAMDGGSNRWVGTSEGITVFDNSNIFSANHTTVFTLPAPDTLNPIEDLKIDNNGFVWVGVYVDYLVTEGGVCAYNGSSWIEYHVADGLVGPVVRQLAVDGDNAIWVATSTGVSKISDHNVSLTEIVEEEVNLFPNPTNNKFAVTWNASDVSSIQVYSADQRLIETKSVSAGETSAELSLQGKPSGIYFVVIGKHVSRLVKN